MRRAPQLAQAGGGGFQVDAGTALAQHHEL
jgi:hypothetical protein